MSPHRRRRRSLFALSALGLGAVVMAATGPGLTTPAVGAPTAKPTGPNPYLSTLPPGAKPNYAAWQRLMRQQAHQRTDSPARQAAQRRSSGRAALPAPLVYDEQEPAALRGSNDKQANAEPIPGFGTGAQDNPRLRLLGTTAKVTVATRGLTGIKEDNGQLSKATNTKISGRGGITTAATLGDGPHGRKKGDGKNDYDFYRLTVSAGQQVIIDTSGTTKVDTVVALYNASGKLLGSDDDGGSNGYSSQLKIILPTGGTYYALVTGFGGATTLPPNPKRSDSGRGGNAEGAYKLKLTAGPYETDYFAVDLAKGDVLGGTAAGSADKITVYRPDGAQRVTAEAVDASAIYPADSPLPGGGNTAMAYVAEQTGRYAVRIDGAVGRYDTAFEVYRPGPEIDTAPQVQTIFLDFDGQRLNTGIFGGAGVRSLSPFSAFLPRWGLSKAQEATMIDRITATVRENVEADIRARGLDSTLRVQILNSKDSPDVFGEPNVSRVVVGGTIEESGVSTIGIAQSIDPGNFAHEETALVLLDVLSDDDRSDVASLNYYLRAGSDRIGFVSRAIGNVTSHEIGHYLGSFHTDNGDGVHNMMDSGGRNFGSNLYGVGKDKIGGTADDEDIDFRTDAYAPEEGFAGQEDTLNVTAWALARGRNVN